MAAAVGQFGTLYLEQSSTGVWVTLPAVTMELNGADLTVMGYIPLEGDINTTEERVYVVRATYSDTPPTTGERVFVPV